MNEHEFAAIIKDTKPVVLSAIERNLMAAYYNFIDDVAQETYLRAYRALSKNSFKGDSSLSTWIYAIARNEAKRMNFKLLKEENKIKRKAEKELQKENQSEALQVDIDILALNEGINSLPDKYKEVMLLVRDGYSTNEISFKLKLNSSTVKSRASRGKEFLRIFMEDKSYD
jgi:RNA polymerase sigma factor (sigma-70 family)